MYIYLITIIKNYFYITLLNFTINTRTNTIIFIFFNQTFNLV